MCGNAGWKKTRLTVGLPERNRNVLYKACEMLRGCNSAECTSESVFWFLSAGALGGSNLAGGGIATTFIESKPVRRSHCRGRKSNAATSPAGHFCFLRPSFSWWPMRRRLRQFCRHSGYYWADTTCQGSIAGHKERIRARIDVCTNRVCA